MFNIRPSRTHRRIMRPIIIACLFTVQCFWLTASYAWNQVGHMVVAQIAYDQLSPAMQKKVSQMSLIVGNYFPAYASFVSSAAWADAIKGNDVKAFNNWHFINQRFSYVKMRLPKYIPRENVVWAINQSDRVLGSSDANAFEKSLFLRFLVHFTGDAHQPTQCSNFYSWKFQKGDNGGTKYPIDSIYATNLHQYWDRGLGLLMTDKQKEPIGQEVKQLAGTIEKKYPPSYFGKQATQLDPSVWAKESFNISRTFAYRGMKPGGQPSEAYITKGRDIVEQQLALAGYRLANLLDKLMGGSSNSPAV